MTNSNSKTLSTAKTSFPSDKTPYRHFFCKECNISVEICVSCDRNQIYCGSCSSLCKKRRIKKARTKYAGSARGKRARSAQSKNRYKRKKREAKKDFQGDHSSPSCPPSVTDPSPAILLAQGVQNENSLFNRDEKTTLSQVSKNGKKQVVCAFCHKECAPYRRPSGSWRKSAKIWEKSALYSKGGPPT